jgi:hypothetical protein
MLLVNMAGFERREKYREAIDALKIPLYFKWGRGIQRSLFFIGFPDYSVKPVIDYEIDLVSRTIPPEIERRRFSAVECILHDLGSNECFEDRSAVRMICTPASLAVAIAL